MNPCLRRTRCLNRIRLAWRRLSPSLANRASEWSRCNRTRAGVAPGPDEDGAWLGTRLAAEEDSEDMSWSGAVRSTTSSSSSSSSSSLPSLSSMFSPSTSRPLPSLPSKQSVCCIPYSTESETALSLPPMIPYRPDTPPSAFAADSAPATAWTTW